MAVQDRRIPLQGDEGAQNRQHTGAERRQLLGGHHNALAPPGSGAHPLPHPPGIIGGGAVEFALIQKIQPSGTEQRQHLVPKQPYSLPLPLYGKDQGGGTLGEGHPSLSIGGIDGESRPLQQLKKPIKRPAGQGQLPHPKGGRRTRLGGDRRHLCQQKIQQRAAFRQKGVPVVEQGQIPSVVHRFTPLHPPGKPSQILDQIGLFASHRKGKQRGAAGQVQTGGEHHAGGLPLRHRQVYPTGRAIPVDEQGCHRILGGGGC